MRIKTSGKDLIVAGKVYHPDEEGHVEVPDELAKAEGHAPSEPMADTKTSGDASPKGPKPLEEMKAGELIAYAAAEKLDIGDMKPQAGQERILAAVREAIAKKAPEGEA